MSQDVIESGAVKRMLDAAYEYFPAVLKHNTNASLGTVVLFVGPSPKNSTDYGSIALGSFRADQLKNAWLHARDRATRLASNQNHVSSRQSRNVNQGLFGGALRLKNIAIGSCAGLDEEMCELFVCAIARKADLISKEHAFNLSQLADHDFKRGLYHKICDAMQMP